MAREATPTQIVTCKTQTWFFFVKGPTCPFCYKSVENTFLQPPLILCFSRCSLSLQGSNIDSLLLGRISCQSCLRTWIITKTWPWQSYPLCPVHQHMMYHWRAPSEPGATCASSLITSQTPRHDGPIKLLWLHRNSYSPRTRWSRNTVSKNREVKDPNYFHYQKLNPPYCFFRICCLHIHIFIWCTSYL